MSLISEIRQDLDASALQLITEYRDRLFAEAVRLSADVSVAEDLVSRTLDKAIRNLESHHKDESVFGWMKTIMLNLHRNDVRNPVRRGTTPVDPSVLEEYSEADWKTDEEILKRSDSQALREAIGRLDPELKKAMVLHYLSELPVKQIAIVMNVPVGTVLWRLNIARKILARDLADKIGKKPLAVLLAALLGIGTLFGAWQAGLADWVASWREPETDASAERTVSADGGLTGARATTIEKNATTGVESEDNSTEGGDAMNTKTVRKAASAVMLSVAATGSFLTSSVGMTATAGGVSLLAAGNADAAVYLKPLGSGETRETQDGESWATAFANIDDAVAEAVEASKPIYAAGGIYTFTQCITLTAPLAVYGGFPGVNDAETLSDRNMKLYETVFTGDSGLDDYWVHCETNASCGVTKTELKDNLIISNGKLNMPPAFTGDFDAYAPGKVGTNVKAAFYVSSGAMTLDGVTFTGFYTTDQRAPCDNPSQMNAVLMVDAGSLDVSRCRFIGNTYAMGAVYGRSAYTMQDSEVLYCWGGLRGSALTVHAAVVATATDCRFVSIARTSDTCSQLFNAWGAGTFRIYNCEISRSLLGCGSKFNSSYGGPANILGGEKVGFGDFRDCVISNCYTATLAANGLPMFSGNPTYQLTRCLLKNNLGVCSPDSGRAYCLLGRVSESGARRVYESTTFSGNVYRAQEVAAESGSYAIGIVGNNADGTDATLVNCTFDANEVIAPEKEGVSRVLSRGVLTYATKTQSTTQLGLANCTFTGRNVADVYEIVQFGTSHAKDLNIVNCIFDVSDGAAARPVYADVPDKVHFIQSSVLGCFTHDSSIDYEGLEYDKIPLVKTVVDAKTGRYVYLPDAKVPGLRMTCDVATNHMTMTASSPMSWVFRRPGSSEWVALSSNAAKTGKTWDDKLIADARNAVRSAGAFTRGAVQALTATAETGKSIVTRINPPSAGTLTGPASQSFATGSAMRPVTVTSTDEKTYVFDGWYDADGALVSSAATLAGYLPGNDMGVVTARFDVPSVNLTFDLGECGTFAENGSSRITVSARMGAAFPAVPSYTIKPEWHFIGFTLPGEVPTGPTTYEADYETKALRVVYVTPEGAGDRDGTSWQNAYSDLAAAYADAGRYRGEVWVKKGVYRIPSALSMKANVSILGGFAGDETSAEEADPAANQTVLSGDVNDDDYWSPNGAGGTLATHKIWQDGVFNPPNPEHADGYWAASGNVSDNTLTLFVSGGVVTNNAFAGLVFTGFTDGMFTLTDGNCAGISFSRCRFLGNNARASTTTEMNGVIRLVCSCRFEDCEFDGNFAPITAVPTAAGQRLSVRRCAFKNGYCKGYVSGGIRMNGNGLQLELSDSLFWRNYCSGRNYQAGAALSLYGSCSAVVTDCFFDENVNEGDSHGSVVLSGSSTATLLRCRFERNVLSWASSTLYETLNAACIARLGSGFVLTRDCLFADNVLTIGAGVLNDGLFSVALGTSATQPSVIVNTTLLRNVVAYHDAASKGAVITVAGDLAMVGCTVKDSAVAGESSDVADIRVPGAATCGLVNTVVASTNDGYRALLAPDANWAPSFASSYVQGFDRAAYEPLAANGYLYDVVTSGSASLALHPVTNDLGVVAWGVRALGPVRARPVWLKDNLAYFYDVANAAKPWRKVSDRTSYADSVADLDRKTPVIPDAFGKKRSQRGSSIGPLEFLRGLVISIW